VAPLRSGLERASAPLLTSADKRVDQLNDLWRIAAAPHPHRDQSADRSAGLPRCALPVRRWHRSDQLAFHPRAPVEGVFLGPVARGQDIGFQPVYGIVQALSVYVCRVNDSQASVVRMTQARRAAGAPPKFILVIDKGFWYFFLVSDKGRG
jgi:hypothetical protein